MSATAILLTILASFWTPRTTDDIDPVGACVYRMEGERACMLTNESVCARMDGAWKGWGSTCPHG
jgi:hypothetical protein